MDWRNIWHPTYGNYGGGNQNGKNKNLSPIDIMDTYFMFHDTGLQDANGDKYKEYSADSLLYLSLLELKLNQLKRPIYGRLYWFGSVIIFGFIHYFRKFRE